MLVLNGWQAPEAVCMRSVTSTFNSLFLIRRLQDNPMADLLGPDFITLQVRNLEVLRHFYDEGIGLKKSPEVQPNAVAFATQPIRFAIRQAQIDLAPVLQPGHGIILWFRTTDTAALHGQLQKHNKEFIHHANPTNSRTFYCPCRRECPR